MTYTRALMPEENFNDMMMDGRKNDDEESLKEKQDNLKDVQENPYVKVPKKAKIK